MLLLLFFIQHICRYDLEDVHVSDCCSVTVWLDLDKENPAPEAYPLGHHDTGDWDNCPGHTFVSTPNFFVDFTARQYRSTNPYPLIIPKCVALVKTAKAGGTL